MDYNSLGEKGKIICNNYAYEDRAEEFEMLMVLIDERIKTLVPGMIADYIKQNPQKAELDFNQFQNQLSNLFKNVKF